MKILTAKQINEWELQTLKITNSDSYMLMNKASLAVANWIDKKLVRDNLKIAIICGWGNNGGDGFMVAEILLQKEIRVDVFALKSEKYSELNLYAKSKFSNPIVEVNSLADLQCINEYDLVIDAILGIGINREPNEDLIAILKYINQFSKWIMSIDIPSGMYSDRITNHYSIYAHECCTFSTPKLSFFSSTNAERLKSWILKDIELDQGLYNKIPSNNFYLTNEFLQDKIFKRKKFTHKGTYGNVLLVGGSYGMAGSISMSATACFKMGAGLVTISSSELNRVILQQLNPTCIFRKSGEEVVSDFTIDFETHDCIGVGPGLGKDLATQRSFLDFLNLQKEYLILDADALNIIAENSALEDIPLNSIITPHPKEFDRLFGVSENDFERRDKQRKASLTYSLYIILKGAYTTISAPNGDMYYNSSGNPGMACGGSGDILFGMICGLNAQGYENLISCQLAVYLHGLAGDLASKEIGEMSMLATDIITYIPQAIKMIS